VAGKALTALLLLAFCSVVAATAASAALDSRASTGSRRQREERLREFGLTPREGEILAWVARGKTNPQIAETLLITTSTVRKHLENIYPKLGVQTRTAAVTRLLGVLDDEPRV
jgi:DNA-binding CsgD family transcriptional regulator